MLKDDFYTITSIQKEDASYKVALQLNATHPIYQGHFPGQPVLPGACMLQMVKEISALILDKNLQLKKADNIKFLAMVNPEEHNDLQMNITANIIEGDIVNVIATLLNGKAVCLRFNGSFQMSS